MSSGGGGERVNLCVRSLLQERECEVCAEVGRPGTSAGTVKVGDVVIAREVLAGPLLLGGWTHFVDKKENGRK